MSFRNVCSFTKFAGPILPDPSTTNTKSAFCKHPEKKNVLTYIIILTCFKWALATKSIISESEIVKQ